MVERVGPRRTKSHGTVNRLKTRSKRQNPNWYLSYFEVPGADQTPRFGGKMIVYNKLSEEFKPLVQLWVGVDSLNKESRGSSRQAMADVSEKSPNQEEMGLSLGSELEHSDDEKSVSSESSAGAGEADTQEDDGEGSPVFSPAHAQTRGEPAFAQEETLPQELLREIEATRERIASLLAARSAQESITEQQVEMEWELWILTGVLDHNISADKLFAVRSK